MKFKIYNLLSSYVTKRWFTILRLYQETLNNIANIFAVAKVSMDIH